MRFTADVSELSRVEAALGLAALRVVPAVARQVDESAQRVAQSARQLVAGHRRTGDTHRSIYVDRHTLGLAADIGPTTIQGARLERGTAHHPPFPYLTPAVELEARQFAAGCAAAMTPL